MVAPANRSAHRNSPCACSICSGRDEDPVTKATYRTRRPTLAWVTLQNSCAVWDTRVLVNTAKSMGESASGNQWFQKTIKLPAFERGCHVITRQIYKTVPEIQEYSVGIAHLFLLHTSASLTINENFSSDVPLDMEDALNKIVPEGRHYRHLDEGLDDMPAHVKASLMGSSLTIPVTAGKFNLGTWQGIWLNEHRNHGGSRSICVTIQGQKR